MIAEAEFAPVKKVATSETAATPPVILVISLDIHSPLEFQTNLILRVLSRLFPFGAVPLRLLFFGRFYARECPRN